MAVSAAELLEMRSGINAFLPELPTITRGGVTQHYVMPDGTPIRCKVNSDQRDTRVEGSTRLVDQRRWRIKFPDSTDIRPGDRITVLGAMYGVVEVVNPTTWSLSTEVLTYQLFDVHGVPVYIQPNAVVNSTRKNVTKLVAAPAYIAKPAPKATPQQGGEVTYDALLLPGADIAAGDTLFIASWNTNTVNPSTPYRVREADPVGSFGFDMVAVSLMVWVGR